MTTESAFVPAGDSDNSTGYEPSAENVDGKEIFHMYFITKLYCHLLNNIEKIKILS